jgi:hypothetical protein
VPDAVQDERRMRVERREAGDEIGGRTVRIALRIPE